MATGDILSCVINSDGWSADITVEGISSGGTYDFGLGTNNDPSTAKIILSLTSEGYSTSGVLGTTTRTIYGVPCKRPTATGAMRKVYPDNASPQETVSGSDLIIRVALSENIYNDDTAITVDIASDWYNDGTNNNNSCNDLTITNNSILDYTKVVANWGVPNRKLITGNFSVEFLAFHGFAKDAKQCACVKITATDEHTNSVTYTLTTMSKSTLLDYKTVIAYIQTIDVSTLADGDLITIQAQAYPWVGDADSVLDTNDAVNTFPTPLYTNLKYRLDKAGDHGHTCVSAGGNNTSGTVYSSQSAAEAGNHFLTIAAALTALQSYHNTNSGHNDAGGGTIYLDESTWTLNSANGGTLSQWITITRQSGTTKDSVILRAAGSSSEMPTYLRLYDLNHDGTGTYYFTGSDTKCLWLDSCTLTKSSSIIVWNTTYSVCTHCTGSINTTYGFRPYSTSVSVWGLVRGNNFNDRIPGLHYVCVGNHNTEVQDRNSVMPSYNNGIYTFNLIDDESDATAEITLASTYDIDGYAFIQNLIIRYGNTTEPGVSISADGTTTTTNNIILQHNTVVGARENFGYNDIASGGPYAQTNWFDKNNIWDNFNNKDDTFGNNADAIGGWPVGYGVGASGNLRRTATTNEWMGEFEGLYTKYGTAASPLDPVYIDDNSYRGANTSGGDYHLQSTSPAIDLAHDLILPYDLDGVVRTADGESGAYVYISLIYLSGSLLNTLNCTTSLSRLRGYLSLLNNTSNLNISLLKMLGLNTVIDNTSNIIAALITSNILELSAILSNTSNISSQVVRLRAINATLQNTSNIISTLARCRDISATLNNTVNIVANLLTEIFIELAATIPSISNINTNLSKLLALLAIINNTVNITGVLTTPGAITAETQNIYGFIEAEYYRGDIDIEFIKSEIQSEYYRGDIYAG